VQQLELFASEGPRVFPHNRKYLGSKYRLLDFLSSAILSRAGGAGSFIDLFAGTGVVACHFGGVGWRVVANDLLYHNYVVNRAFLTCTAAQVSLQRVRELLGQLDALPPRPGYAHRSYGGSYFTLENAARIDAVRERIEELRRQGECSEQERYVLLASLLFAVDKVANTVGQYDAFLKHIDGAGGDGAGGEAAQGGRHLIDSNVTRPLRLRLPALQLWEASEGEGGAEAPHRVYNEDANELIRRVEGEVLYLDPPYNGRQYVDCYHVLENIMRWDKPHLYGKTRKFPRGALKSRYSRRQEAPAALAELLERARAGHIFLSYNDEGIMRDDTIRAILGRLGKVEVFEQAYAVFGNGAGSSRRRMVTERLYHCRPARGVARRRGAGERPEGQGKVELFGSAGESRGFYSGRNRLNDLTGREWVYWSKSVINRPYPPNLQHQLRSRHGGQKPPDLCGDLIEVFTKRGQRVLDPFAGVGGTLLGASLRGRESVGIEINPEWVELYRQVCRLEGLPEQRMICGDSARELPGLAQGGERFQLILTDVPYGGMDRVQKSRGKYKRVGEAQRERRPSKLSPFGGEGYGSREQWLTELSGIFGLALPLLDPNRYVVVFIGDMYHGGRYHFLSAELAGALAGLGLTLKADLVWYDVSKSLHVYGYQYEFIPSMIHQSILVFRKEEGARPGGARSGAAPRAEARREE
jgi:adenine-specific DNA methylase